MVFLLSLLFACIAWLEFRMLEGGAYVGMDAQVKLAAAAAIAAALADMLAEASRRNAELSRAMTILFIALYAGHMGYAAQQYHGMPAKQWVHAVGVTPVHVAPFPAPVGIRLDVMLDGPLPFRLEAPRISVKKGKGFVPALSVREWSRDGKDVPVFYTARYLNFVSKGSGKIADQRTRARLRPAHCVPRRPQPKARGIRVDWRAKGTPQDRMPDIGAQVQALLEKDAGYAAFLETLGTMDAQFSRTSMEALGFRVCSTRGKKGRKEDCYCSDKPGTADSGDKVDKTDEGDEGE